RGTSARRFGGEGGARRGGRAEVARPAYGRSVARAVAQRRLAGHAGIIVARQRAVAVEERDELRERREGPRARAGTAADDRPRAEAPPVDATARAAAQGGGRAGQLARPSAQRSAGAAAPGDDARDDGADAEAGERVEGDGRRSLA